MTRAGLENRILGSGDATVFAKQRAAGEEEVEQYVCTCTYSMCLAENPAKEGGIPPAANLTSTIGIVFRL